MTSTGEGVLLGNDHLCNLAGIGTIRIKMHDRVICILVDIKHIIDLTKNLISLGALEDVGCKFQIEGGVLQVSKRPVTLMKAKSVGTLYFLDGSTIMGLAATISSTSELNNIKSLHMRLGQKSEGGMMILSKRGLLCSQKHW